MTYSGDVQLEDTSVQDDHESAVAMVVEATQILVRLANVDASILAQIPAEYRHAFWRASIEVRSSELAPHFRPL